MPKNNADGVPETFKSFIQKDKFERERRRLLVTVIAYLTKQSNAT
jgi:hypothetical protein